MTSINCNNNNNNNGDNSYNGLVTVIVNSNKEWMFVICSIMVKCNVCFWIKVKVVIHLFKKFTHSHNVCLKSHNTSPTTATVTWKNSFKII